MPAGTNDDAGTAGHAAFGLFGLAMLLSIVVLFSNNRRAIDVKLVLTGVALQIAFAAFVLKAPIGRQIFDALASGFVTLLGFTRVGTNFLFGQLMDNSKFGFIVAFEVLPTIVFFAALTGVFVPPWRDAADRSRHGLDHHARDESFGARRPPRSAQVCSSARPKPR